MKLGNQQGFTLVELMIVVAIIGILATIAYPSYTQYKQKVSRGEVKAEMLMIASDLQKYKVVNNGYLINNTPITLSTLGRIANYPTHGPTLYQIALEDVTRHGWTLIATPKNQQEGTGGIALNHRGEKCWVKGAAVCSLSSTSSWDE